MTYVVNEKCVKCKFTDCVAVCPVDCFHEGENMLVINPKECIDCGICVDECPIKAIDKEEDSTIEWIEINSKYSKKWPVINKVLEPLPEAEKYKNIADKKHLISENPGSSKHIRKEQKYNQ